MNYTDIINSDFFKQTYSVIEELKKDYPVNHGFIHVQNVINNCKNFAKLFNLNKHETELLLISAALHDVGYLNGRNNHASSGAVIAKEYLINNSTLSIEDIEIISSAIYSHGGFDAEDYKSKISLCLILADKLDFYANRYGEAEKYPEYKEELELFKTVQDIKLNKIQSTLFLNITSSNPNFLCEQAFQHYLKRLDGVFDHLKNVYGYKTLISVSKEKSL